LILFIRCSPSLREIGVLSHRRELTRRVSTLVDQIWNAVAENPHITTVKSFNTAQSFVSLPNVVQTSQSIRQLSISNMIYGPEPNADQLVAAIRTNSTLEDVHVNNMGRQDNWAVDVLSVLGSHSLREYHL
jgi:hypothetical protein